MKMDHSQLKLPGGGNWGMDTKPVMDNANKDLEARRGKPE